MTKQQEFNRIKVIIENPKNELKHLDSMSILVDSFLTKYNACNLSKKLIKKYEALEAKFK